MLPQRWVVERTLSWISRCRRLDHDYERLPEHSEAMVQWAMIGLMTRSIQVGYARVSTVDQTLALQREALSAAGCERIFTDTVAFTYAPGGGERYRRDERSRRRASRHERHWRPRGDCRRGLAGVRE